MNRKKKLILVIFIFMSCNLQSKEIDLPISFDNPNGWRLPKEKYLKLISTEIKEISGIKINEEKYDYIGGYSTYLMNNRMINGKVDFKEWEREWPREVSVFKKNEDNKILLYWMSSTPEMMPLHEGLLQEQENLEAGISGGLTGDITMSFYLDLDDDGKYETMIPDPLFTDEIKSDRFIGKLIVFKLSKRKFNSPK